MYELYFPLCLVQLSKPLFCILSAFDYRLHHRLIYSFLMGNIFLSLSNILKLGNLTCVLVLGKEHSYGKILPSWTWYLFNSHIVDSRPGSIMYSVSAQRGLGNRKHVLALSCGKIIDFQIQKTRKCLYFMMKKQCLNEIV